jgi:hypothetical protein
MIKINKKISRDKREKNKNKILKKSETELKY